MQYFQWVESGEDLGVRLEEKYVHDNYIHVFPSGGFTEKGLTVLSANVTGFFSVKSCTLDYDRTGLLCDGVFLA